MSDFSPIVNVYPMRQRLEAMPVSSRRSYLEQLVGSREPHMCLVPPIDGTHVTKLLDGRYRGYSPSDGGATTLVYDVNRVSVRRLDVSYSTDIRFQHLDVDKLACTRVDVYSLQPSSTKVKEYNLMTWERGTFRNVQEGGRGDGEREDEDNMSLFERFIALCQWLALTTGVPVIIGGEVSLFLQDILKILKKNNKEMREDFVKTSHENRPESKSKYLPSMTEGSAKPYRDLFELKAVCPKGSEDKFKMSDFVITSKQMLMTDPVVINAASTVDGGPVAMGLRYAMKNYGG